MGISLGGEVGATGGVRVVHGEGWEGGVGGGKLLTSSACPKDIE